MFAGAVDATFGSTITSMLPLTCAGTADGTGTAARFKGPMSLVFCPIADVLYVADHFNSRVRKITREGFFSYPSPLCPHPPSGVVTTLFGANNVRCGTDWYDDYRFPWGPPAVCSCGGGERWGDQVRAPSVLPNFSFHQACARSNSVVECGPGGRPDVFVPQTIRVDSKGNIILLELGYGSIRRFPSLILFASLLTLTQPQSFHG